MGSPLKNDQHFSDQKLFLTQNFPSKIFSDQKLFPIKCCSDLKFCHVCPSKQQNFFLNNLTNTKQRSIWKNKKKLNWLWHNSKLVSHSYFKPPKVIKRSILEIGSCQWSGTPSQGVGVHRIFFSKFYYLLEEPPNRKCQKEINHYWLWYSSKLI